MYKVGEIAVSEPCHDITLPGEVSLFGFLGHNDSFTSQGGDGCGVCPHDDLYNEKTNKNENNEYIC